ncbi:hypothetical protein BGX21_006097, partial [Mortierella sp. AD011]
PSVSSVSSPASPSMVSERYGILHTAHCSQQSLLLMKATCLHLRHIQSITPK